MFTDQTIRGQPEAMISKLGFELGTSLGGDFRHGGEMFTDQTMVGQPGAMMGNRGCEVC